MASKKSSKPDVSESLRAFGAQFQGLDTRDPSSWPVVPRYTLLALVAAVVAGVLWFIWVQNYADELEAERNTEATLRQDYTKKLQKAVSLEELKKQREQVIQYVTLLEKQLPSKSEMDALLSDINQAGLGRSLQFELFRPGQVAVKEYYAELPIALKVTGNYHDIGAFAADIANLSRIVTLNNVNVTPLASKDAANKDAHSGTLMLDATAKTFRYLDQEEVEAQRRAAASARQKK